MKMLPWDYHPELTAERLVKVAQLLALGRGSAVDRFDPAIGDDNWTLGVCAYNYGCFQIAKAAGTLGFEWLGVIDPGKHFQFSIGGVPMRFWRGDPAEPTAKISIATPFEQLLLDLEPGILTAGVLFRIGVTTDMDGALLGASFVALRNDQAELVWPLPLAEAEPLIVLLDEARPEGIELSSPSVSDHGYDEDEHGDDIVASSDKV
ncbi:hypothetical protein EOA33_21900 [Mesorhizobium sp. M4A.F.Ca.ET.050.02.1.1]|uniref:hypothetical protein n=1 Tax=Mesorhizobium sp. M4A.F.Ca.ET.050.02.1.1 TaxID=2496754 RepID=UPI000FCA6A67|nr:hypothetical protein [Mesorhizobium sp. M4A.F.Ca.ET.050.02.1.1]RUX46203.1 hypothetical protein EOA33_21900 [Mesorhizobium sp. M4A.F.Ca.ET.050.02.1.1]